MIDTHTHKDIEDVLREPRAKGVKEVYYVIREVGQNITVVVDGLNGTEYNKTYGHFHTYMGVEMYACLSGQGLLLMQRNDEDGEAKEFKVVTLHPGRQVEVPSGFGHGLINIGKGLLVTLDNAPDFAKSHDYQPIKNKRGFAYYVIEKKGEVAFEPNPEYKVHPQITSE